MAVISVDAYGQVRRATPQRRSFRQRNAVTSFHVATDKTPTEFGYELLKLMEAAGLWPAGLARAAGTGASTISRLIYGGVDKPDSNTLERIARALVEATLPRGATRPDTETAVAEMHNKLLHAAGYRIGAAPETRQLHPLALELDQMIGDGTPLPAADVEFLAVMTDRLMDPYRRKFRKRAG